MSRRYVQCVQAALRAVAALLGAPIQDAPKVKTCQCGLSSGIPAGPSEADNGTVERKTTLDTAEIFAAARQAYLCESRELQEEAAGYRATAKKIATIGDDGIESLAAADAELPTAALMLRVIRGHLEVAETMKQTRAAMLRAEARRRERSGT